MEEKNESILTSIKKMLGVAEEYEVFDSDIIVFINTAFSTLLRHRTKGWICNHG